ncbi:hypothetical protein, partial [Salmonella sp. s57936]|uniref:hypothetical protein n=1 Tax=Salmonella sp. s57936 TaxID=3159698 RepID=UPI0039815063
EVIQAVQSLKRAHRAGSNDTLISTTLSRLIKSDLIAAFNELLCQDHCHLALRVFSALRSEYPTGLTAYADLVSALARKQLWHHIDHLILELEQEGVIRLDDKGLVRLVKAVIAAGRGESTVRIY